MKKPGKIFDMENKSPWGCFGLTSFVFVFGCIAIYFSIVSIFPFTEYTCDYRYNLAPFNSPVQAYPESSTRFLSRYDQEISSLPYRIKVKGYIVDKDGDVVTLKINAYKLYKRQYTFGARTGDGDFITDNFQNIKGAKINLPEKVVVSKTNISPVLTLFHICIIFVFIVPFVLFLMRKINEISQGSIQYLAGTDDEYKSFEEKKTKGFTKKK
jgi:subtilase family serine protease